MVRFGLCGVALMFTVGCGSCLGLDEGRPYPCEMDSGLPNECPAKWRCGLERSGQPRCHAVGKPGPYVCATDDACEGWHCGVAGVCYDRTDAGAIDCRADAGDCADDWRCNPRGKVCQRHGVGAPYACFTDDDCEAQWRCGLSDTCVDATSEALRPNVPGLAVSRVSPPWTLDGGPDHFAASPPQQGQTLGAVAFSHALTSGTTAHLFHFETLGPVVATHHTAPIPTPVTGLTATRGAGFFASPSGVVRVTPASVEPFSSLQNAQLRMSWDNPPRIAGWSGTDLFVAVVTADAGVAFTAPAPVASVTFAGTLGAPPGTMGTMWVATDAGLFVEAGGVLQPLALDPLRSPCDGGGSDLALSVQPVSEGLAVEVQPPDAGRRALDLFTGSAAPTAQACTPQGFTFVRQCTPCEPGAQPRVETGVITAAVTSLRVSCLGPGHRRTVGMLEGACVLTPESATADALPNEGSNLATWVTEAGAITDARPITPTTAAFAAGTRADLRLFDKVPGVMDEPFVVDGPIAAAVTSGLPQVCASVAGRPWALGTSMDLSATNLHRGLFLFSLERTPDGQAFGPQLAALDGTNAYGFFDFSPPPSVLPVTCFENGEPLFHAATGTTRDGGEVLVVAGEDRVWALETARLDAGMPRVPVRTVPAVAGRFQSVAMLDAQKVAGTDYAVGYGLVSQRLFRIRARTSVSWLSDELTLPDGEPVALWADGPNARVGYADGRVFSAASRVQLAPPTPAPVRAYASMCGEGFALTATALYRLTPADGGTWAPVDLAAAQLPSLAGARMYGTDRALIISTPGGTIGKLTVPSCQ